MPKILLVSWGVPPLRTGSSTLVQNIIENFNKKHLVVIGEVVKNLPLLKNSKSLPPIHYLNPKISFLEKLGRNHKWFSFFSILDEITKVAKKHKCDRIFAIFPDEIYLTAAYMVSKKLNLPLYVWFHNTWQDNRTGIWKIFAKKMQHKVFDRAKKLFVMSEGMKNYLNKKYPNYKFQVLQHGFPAIKTLPIKDEQKTTRVKFIYSGNLNASCQEASIRICNYIIKNPSYELHIFGNGNEVTFKRLGFSGENIIYRGFIPDESFVEELSKGDIMLLPHGFSGPHNEVEYLTIFPTRTIPLLATGKPILAHAPRHCFLTKFLEEKNCALVISEKSEEKIQHGINQLLSNNNYVKTLTENAKMTRSFFDIENVVNIIKTEILLD